MGKMTSRSLIIKQSIKYFLIIVVFLTAIFLTRILWNLPSSFHLFGLIVGVVIISIAFVFDALTIKDAIPLLKD